MFDERPSDPRPTEPRPRGREDRDSRDVVPKAESEDLLRRVAAGDVVAMGAIYDRYAPRLFAIALRILRDRGEAEDLVHDAFVLLHARAGQYAPERGAVQGWLVGITRNLAIDRLRQRGRRHALGRELVHQLPAAIGAHGEESATTARTRSEAMRLLSTIPAPQRAVLEQVFFEGKSFPDIAKSESVPLGTVKSRAGRGLAALRDGLRRAE